MLHRPTLTLVFSLFVGLLVVARAPAAVVTFNINPAASSLTLTGDFMDQSLQPQTAGSTTTSYGGTIMADLVGNTIQFVNGSSIDANLQGSNQQPRANGDAGSAPADYGFTASIPVIGTAQGALRNFVLGASSAPLTVTANTFTPNINFADSSGDLDYLSPVTFGRSDLSSSSGNGAVAGGMLQTVGSTQTLTIPVDITFTSSTATTDDSSLHFTGTLVATRLVPEPATVGLLVLLPARLAAAHVSRAVTPGASGVHAVAERSASERRRGFESRTTSKSPRRKTTARPPQDHDDGAARLANRPMLPIKSA